MSFIDNAAVARIAARDLTNDTLALLECYGDNDDVIFFLGRLIWQGEMVECVPALAAVARDPHRGLYARMVSIRAVMALGNDNDKDHLWQSIAEENGPLDRNLLAEVVDAAAPTTPSIDLLLRSLLKLEPAETFGRSNLERSLDNFVDRLPVMADAAETHPLERIVTGLNDLLSQGPFEEHTAPPVSERFAWLVPAALRAVGRLVAAHSRCAFTPAAIEVMQKSGALRYGHGTDLGRLVSSLTQDVGRWTELNDLLYWASIAECRVRLEKEGQPLIDDWQVAYTGPLWGFEPSDFDRCLGWVQSKLDEDDRLVAMSRCVRLYNQADCPKPWREALRTAVRGNVRLEAILEQRLNPTPPAEIRRIEAQNRRLKRQHEARNAKQEASRADWVRALKGDPDRVRRFPNQTPGAFTNDQYYLLRIALGDETATDRNGGANWRALIPEFGDSVAQAYRDAAVAHWRAYKPLLRSEGADAASVPYALLFGMAGLAIEAAEDPDFAERLTEEENSHALRYVTWELNGFPGWFERLYRVRPALGLAALTAELTWEFEQSLVGETNHDVLHDITYHAPWLHAEIASFLLAWFEDHEHPNPNALRYSLSILTASEITNDVLARLAETKSRNVNRLELKAQWLVLWIETDPDQAIAVLEDIIESSRVEDAQQLALLFINALLGDRHGAGKRRNKYQKPEYLKRLYLLMLRYIRPSDDIDRAGRGAYSPTLRDDAQSARGRLFQLLAAIPGEESYAALLTLAAEHPDPRHRPWIALQARTRAIADADEPFWTAKQLRDFAQ